MASEVPNQEDDDEESHTENEEESQWYARDIVRRTNWLYHVDTLKEITTGMRCK